MADYGPPILDFSKFDPIGSFEEGQKIGREKQLRNAFQGGLPKDAQGNLDYGKMADIVARHGGDLGTAIKLGGLDMEARSANQAMQGLQGLFGDQTPKPSTGPAGGGYSGAISSIESGGNYSAQGPVTQTGDRAYGKYQVMGANVGPWTKEILGREMTPQQFLADEKAQDAVFERKFGEYKNKYGPEGAARAWFAGEGGMNDPNRRDQLGTTVASYADKFNRASGTPVQTASIGTPQPDTAPAPQPAGQQVAQAAPAASAGIVGNDPAAQARIDRLTAALANPRVPAGIKDAIKARLEAELKAAEPATERKNYEFHARQMRAAGKDPGTLEEFVNKGKETEQDKKLGAGWVETYQEMIKGGRTAATSLNTLNAMDRIAQHPDFSSGKWSEAMLGLKQAYVALGGNPDKASPMEAFRALANKSILDSLGGSLGNQISNADRDFIRDTTQNIANTPQGNKVLSEIARRTQDRQIQIARAANAYLQRPGGSGKLDAGFDKAMDDFMAKNPLFTDDEKGQIKALAPTQQKAAPKVPKGAADFLIANPKTRDQFDAKYGPGASKQILGGM